MSGHFEFAMNLNGGNEVPVVRKLAVAATQTLVKGDLVILAAGLVTKAGVNLADVLGVMAQDSDGAASGTLVQVYLAMPGQVWRATADADATTHVRAAKLYDINSDQTVDVGDNSNGCILILDLQESSTTAVYVMFTEFALS